MIELVEKKFEILDDGPTAAGDAAVGQEVSHRKRRSSTVYYAYAACLGPPVRASIGH